MKKEEKGNEAYKTKKGVEPLDLFEAGDMLRDFALANIMKYAFRNRRELNKPLSIRDLEKIIHYCEILKRAYYANIL